jgi:hypothetical protein
VPAEVIDAAVIQALNEQGLPSGGCEEAIGTEETNGCFLASVQRAGIGSGQLTLTISRGERGDETRTIQVPQASALPRRRRAVVPCDAGRDGALRPMWMEAHAKLIAALHQVHGWPDEPLINAGATAQIIAKREGGSERSVRMLLSLAFVDPATSRPLSIGACREALA